MPSVDDYIHEGDEFKRGGEWEKAGDAYFRALETSASEGTLEGYFEAMQGLLESYSKVNSYTKIRKACEVYVWHPSFLEIRFETLCYFEDCIEILKRSGELETFVNNVACSREGPDLSSKDEKRIKSVIEGLVKAREASHAVTLFLRFWRACLRDVYLSDKVSVFQLRKVVEGLLSEGSSQKAIEVVKTVIDELATVPGLSLADLTWPLIGEAFLSANACGEAGEFYRFYFSIAPHRVDDEKLVSALRKCGQWPTVLEHAEEYPLEFAGELARCLWSDFSKIKGGGELEAATLLRCYEAVGPRIYEYAMHTRQQKTTHWLEILSEFWRTKGDGAKAEELSFRRREDQRRLEGASPDQRAEKAYKFVDKQEFSTAAEAMERAAAGEPQGEYPGGFLYQAAKLHERAGNADQAAHLYDRLGRPAKANRIRGKSAFDLDEAKPFADMFICDSDYWRKDLLEAEQSSDLQLRTHSIARLLQAPMKKQEGQTWGDWTVVQTLYGAAKSRTDIKGYIAALRQVETKYRDRGRWVFAAKIFLFGGMFDEFDRICQEEDELEVAALWYDQAKMPERAAKIYDLMGQSGRSGKAQSEGAKQTPQDTAKPKSESAEELEEGALEQMVCPQCGAELKPHWTVCPKCDADLQERKCKNCGESLEADWKRCPVCRAPAGVPG